MKLSIVIVTYNSARYMQACLDSIISSDGYSIGSVEIVVFDNHSSDETVNVVSNGYPQVKLSTCTKNLGFAGGNNKAIESTSGEWLLVLNPDTKFAADTMRRTLDLLSRTELENNKTIFVPLQLDYNNDSFLHCGLGMDLFGFPINQGMTAKFFYADGAAILVKRDDYYKIGSLDPDHFIIYEDIDFSWRAQMMGYKLVRAMDIKIHHKRGHTIDASNGKAGKLTTNLTRRYYGEKNSVTNLIKNYALGNLLWTLPILLLLGLTETILYLFLGKTALVKKYLEAYLWNVKNIHNTLSKRKVIQSKRVVGDREIIKSMYFGSGKLNLFLQGGVPNING